jgi:hypothetical protein
LRGLDPKGAAKDHAAGIPLLDHRANPAVISPSAFTGPSGALDRHGHRHAKCGFEFDRDKRVSAIHG